MRTVKVSEPALAVISQCIIESYSPAFGVPGSTVRIVDGQLERKLYAEVDTVLREIGGKWNRKVKAHIFDQPPRVTEDRLDGVILSGEIAPLRKNGFFPTPRVLAATMATQLRVKQGQRILEPSAGAGSLVDAVLAVLGSPRIDTTIRVLELNMELAQNLANKYADQPTVFVNPVDCLTWYLDARVYAYDRIIMNPPFENRADAKHVLHAFSLLKPSGRLVAIMSASVTYRREGEYQQVRDLIETCGTVETLPPATFKESGTMVNTVLVVLDKPES